MKVLMSARAVHPFHNYGGAERYVHELAAHLSRLGVEVEVIAPPPDKESDERGDSQANTLKTTFIKPKVGYGRFFRFYRTYHHFNLNSARYLRENDSNADIVHLYEITSWPYFFMRRKKEKPKIIVQPFHRGTEPWRTGKLGEKIFNLPMDAPLKYTLEHADAVAVEGDIQARRLMERYRIEKEKFVHIRDGVDLAKIDEKLRVPVKTRADVGFGEDDYVIINVGRIQPEKGTTYLIEALNEIKKEADSVKLIIVGKGTDEERVHELIRRYGLESDVRHFKDVVEDQLYSYYKMADVFITPTIYEGLPIVVLEAMACSLPVIVTNAGENPQVVRDGVNGLLVQVRDSKSIADSALKLMNDRKMRERMGRNSRNIVEDYDWNKIAQETIKEYERILG